MYEKKRSDEFEIVYMSLDCDEVSPSSFLSSIQSIPWLVHALAPDFAVSLARVLFSFPLHLPALVAFDADGHMESKQTNLLFKVDCNPDYPFISEMDEEVHFDLLTREKWGFEHLDQESLYGTPTIH